MVKPGKRREAVAYLVQCHGQSERRTCGVLRQSRATQRYTSKARDQSPLRIRLRDLALSRPRYGYRRLHVLLRREGWTVNAKRVWRHYKLLEPICDGRLGGKSARASSAWSLRLLRAADSSGVWISSQMSSSADRDSAP